MSVFLTRKAQIKTHVFVICPNNSGSTLMANLLRLSDNCWSLEREGQHSFGYHGPVAGKMLRAIDAVDRVDIRMEPLSWAALPESARRIKQPERYDWEQNRKAWYMTATSPNPETANVFVDKTPSYVLIADQLAKVFEDFRPIFMVRNPYAAVQGIARRESNRKYLNDKSVNLTEWGARHIAACLEQQRQNIDAFGDRGLFVTYEELCDDPHAVGQRLREFVPELGELDMRAETQIKERAPAVPVNMNQPQIEALTEAQIDTISSVFDAHTDLLDHFGYPLIGRDVVTEEGSLP